MSDYYVEASIVVCGALDTYETPQIRDGEHPLVHLTFDSWQAFASWFDLTRHELYPITERVEVYVLEHEHELEQDCECVQFLTDHRPYWDNGVEL